MSFRITIFIRVSYIIVFIRHISKPQVVTATTTVAITQWIKSPKKQSVGVYC